MVENNLLSIIIFAPLLGAVINWLIGGKLRNETFSGLVACGSIAISTIVAFMISFGIGTPHEGALVGTQPILDHIWTWVNVGGFRADFALGVIRSRTEQRGSRREQGVIAPVRTYESPIDRRLEDAGFGTIATVTLLMKDTLVRVAEPALVPAGVR